MPLQGSPKLNGVTPQLSPLPAEGNMIVRDRAFSGPADVDLNLHETHAEFESDEVLWGRLSFVLILACMAIAMAVWVVEYV